MLSNTLHCVWEVKSQPLNPVDTVSYQKYNTKHISVQIPMDSTLHTIILLYFSFEELMHCFSIYYALSIVMAVRLDTYFFVWPQNGDADVFYNRLLLWFSTQKKHITLICTPMGWNWRERNNLTKENICIKWKADEKICNYVPDWVKYFSASKCQQPLEPVPNGWLPGLGEAPENVTSERCHLPLHLLFLRSTASASPSFPSPLCSAQPHSASQIMELSFCQRVRGCPGVMTWGGTLWQPGYNNASSHGQSRP